MPDTVLVTGGAGFIGAHLVRALVGRGLRVITVDALTYAAHPDTVASLRALPRHHLEVLDVTETAALTQVLATHRPEAVLHLAAESHVDRSIDDAQAFLRTNVLGTASVLEAITRARTAGHVPTDLRLVHVSTDEVFGSLDDDTSAFTEDSPVAPRSPYAASKASADHLVRAWGHTHEQPAVITWGPNTYGPGQFPEKLVPHMIRRALDGRSLPIYGDGRQRRTWVHVDDHVSGILAALDHGEAGRGYCLGGGEERANLELVGALCDLLDAERPDPAGSYARRITHVADRPGHDRRYAMDGTRAREELGWTAARSLEDGLAETVRWYLDHPRVLRPPGYEGERLGLGQGVA